MIFLKYRFLLFPLFALAMALCVDRFFAIPAIQRELILWKKIEPPLYESRKELQKQLLQKLPVHRRSGKTPALILGSSRSARFPGDVIDERLKNSVTYNFSAPLAPPSFYYYWLDQLQSRNVPLRFVLIEADSMLFTNKAIEYSLSYSYDTGFVLRNTIFFHDSRSPWKRGEGGFSTDEMGTFLLKRLFVTYRYPFSLDTIHDNHKSLTLLDAKKGVITRPALELHDAMIDQIQEINEKKLGGIPEVFTTRIDASDLPRDALLTFENMQLKNFRSSPAQIYFFKTIVENLATRQIPVIVYAPVLSRELRSLMAMEPEIVKFQKSVADFIDEAKRKHPESLVLYENFNESSRLQCREFEDSFHLSSVCFQKLTDLILNDLQAEENKKDTIRFSPDGRD